MSPEILVRWQKLFGGDLIVFSAAIMGLLNRGGDAAGLDIADARAFVRTRYLSDQVLGPEHVALLELAAVAEIEGLVPVDAFARDALKECVRHGIVWVETRGRGGAHSLYRLAHPGLGALLRDAAGCTKTSREDRVRILEEHPYACIAIALRLWKEGEESEAALLLAPLWRNAAWPLNGFPLKRWRSALTAARELRLTTVDESFEKSTAWLAQSENRNLLIKQALMTPLGDLRSFLDYAGSAMPKVASIIHDELAKNPDALMRIALTTPLHFLPTFLDYAGTAMPEVARVIRNGLAKNRHTLAKQALRTPLGDLSSFLDYARTAMPEVARIVHDGLAKDPDALIKQALATPLHFLPTFLDYAGTAMPEVARVIRNGLAKNPDAVVKQALRTPFDHLASFLAYAGRAMPKAKEALRKSLLSGELLPVMAGRAMRNGPEKIAALCNQDEAFAQLIPALDAETWSRRWSDFRYGQPDWFPRFASMCYRVGADNLVGPIGKAIIRTSHHEDFPLPTINLRHVSFIVTSPHGCTPNEIDDFLTRCFPSDWPAREYMSPEAGIGALAGSVRAFAISEDKWIRVRFSDAALLQRLHLEQPTNESTPLHVAAWFQLLSATRLLNNASIHLRPISFRLIRGALAVLPPGPTNEGIQTMQAGLWAGLREWCYISGHSLVVENHLGEGILAQFRAANPARRPRMAALNAVMIDWLRRGQAQGWRLKVDHGSLLDALEREVRVRGTLA